MDRCEPDMPHGFFSNVSKIYFTRPYRKVNTKDRICKGVGPYKKQVSS